MAASSQKPTPSQILFRVLFYLGGLMILAFATCFAVNGALGISPVSSTPRAIYMALQSHGIENISFGTCVTIFYCICVLLQLIILRRNFKPISFLQLVVSFLFGWLVDFAAFVMGDFCFPTYFGRLLMLAISILLIGIALSFYLGARLLPMPSEGLGETVAAKLGRPFHKVKVVLDCIMVSTAFLVMLLSGNNPFLVVREGTIVTALFAGTVIGLLKPLLGPFIRRFGFGETAPATAAGPTPPSAAD